MIYTFVLAAAVAISNIGADPTPAAYKSVGCDFFGPDNAARLLGTKFRGEDTGMKESVETKSWGCTFSRTEAPSERSPKIYFQIKKAISVESAIQDLSAVRVSNGKKSGWEEWPGIGDEAFVHSDAPNFHLVMIRKGVRTIVVKINPADGIALSDVKDVMTKLATKLV